jgi:hypothetical protein
MNTDTMPLSREVREGYLAKINTLIETGRESLITDLLDDLTGEAARTRSDEGNVEVRTGDTRAGPVEVPPLA